ncbi:hypothetical protein MARGE09_P3414 [Marinagarivorans cellulosilyticus]|uniref:Uncharacterized protein n=2 Tax=Marinagarivorans cellulosilyticus TaxID=2721545 RepID=A0AAN2BLJ7_9GAMM|nr:hypothetical protein MARGE09_P3414 [Marinagarivorans cellulosilyticus]
MGEDLYQLVFVYKDPNGDELNVFHRSQCVSPDPQERISLLEPYLEEKSSNKNDVLKVFFVAEALTVLGCRGALAKLLELVKSRFHHKTGVVSPHRIDGREQVYDELLQSLVIFSGKLNSEDAAHEELISIISIILDITMEEELEFDYELFVPVTFNSGFTLPSRLLFERYKSALEEHANQLRRRSDQVSKEKLEQCTAIFHHYQGGHEVPR